MSIEVNNFLLDNILKKKHMVVAEILKNSKSYFNIEYQHALYL